MHPLEKFFDQIYVINLDRRPDRWTQIQSRLKRIGLEDFKRIEAVDGSKPPYYQSWQGLTRLWKGRHKLYTPGSYGYLLSMYRIFKDAVDHKYDSILVLDDDVLFRSDWSVSHYQKLVEKVPEKWKILYFGYCHKNHKGGVRDKDQDRVDMVSTSKFLHLFGHGSINGSFFNGYHSSVFKKMLEMTAISKIPFDTGPMRNYYQTYPGEVLLSYPPAGVQDMTDTDIQGSQDSRRLIKEWGWDMSLYS